MNNSATFIVELKDLASKVAKGIQKALSNLGKSLNDVNGQTDRFNNICSKLQFPDLKAQLEVAGQAADAFKNLTAEGISFGQAIADLSSITGIVGNDLEALTKRARKFGKDSGLGANTAARAYTILASQIQVDKIGMEGLNTLEEQSILLAQAAGMSIDEAAASVASTINQFGLEAAEANRVVNVLAAGSKYGAAEIQDLSESFKIVGSTASAVGLNVEQTTGALEALSKSAIVGGEAGTALRNVLLTLTTKMGVDFNVTSLQDALRALEPEIENTTFLANTFGRQNVNAAISLIQNADAVAELTTQVTATNTAQEQAAIRTETTAHKIEVANAKLANMKIALTNAMGGLSVYASVISDNIVNIMAFVQVGGVMSGMFRKLVGSINAFTKSAVAHKAATLAATAASKAFAVVQTLVNSVLTMNPLGIVITAVAALATAIAIAYNHSEKFRQVCDKVWYAVKQVASAIWDILVRAFETVTDAIKNAWEWLKKFLGIGKKKVEIEAEVTTTVDESNPNFIGPIRTPTNKPVTDPGSYGDGPDKKTLQAFEQAREAYAGLDKQLRIIAETNEIFGESQKTIDDQLVYVRGLIEQIIPVLGRESTEVQGLVSKYKELTVAKSAAVRAKGQALMGGLGPGKAISATAVTMFPATIKPRKNPIETDIADAEAAVQRLNQLQRQLELPGLSEETRKALKSQIAAYKEYLGITGNVAASLKDGWSSVKGLGNGIESLTETLKGNGSAWEKITSSIDAALQVYDGISGVVKILTGVTEGLTHATQVRGVTEMTTAGKTAAAAAMTVAADESVAAAETTKGTAAVLAASGETFAAHASIPFAGIAIAAALVATMIAVMASLPKFAAGGLVYGPTLGIFGEYAGASNNPEVVAPLNKLRSLISTPDGLSNVNFRIQGRDLVGLIDKVNRIDSRVR